MLRRLKSDRGAAAVEFGLILVALVPLVLGMLEGGRALSTYITLTSAAREAARQMTISGNTTNASNAGISAAAGLTLTSGNFSYSAASCVPTTEITVTVSYSAPTLTNFFGTTFPMKVTGAMRCAG